MKRFLLSILERDSNVDSPKAILQTMSLFAREAGKRGLKVRHNKKPLYLLFGRGNLTNPEIGFLCHVDIARPFFKPFIQGKKLFGRGAMDMKGPAAAAFFGLIESKHPNAAIALTGDEETGGETAFRLSKIFKPSEVLIVPDQGRNFDIVIQSKGVIHFCLKAKGKSAHSARPWEGASAAEIVFNIFEELKEKLGINNNKGWNNTLTLSFFKTDNTIFNVLPDSAEAGFDFRFVNGKVDDWRKIIIKIAKTHNAMVEVKNSAEILNVKRHKDLKLFSQILKRNIKKQPRLTKNFGTCDARYFAKKVPCIILVRPIGSSSHSEKEYVNYPSLIKLKDSFRTFLDRKSGAKRAD